MVGEAARRVVGGATEVTPEAAAVGRLFSFHGCPRPATGPGFAMSWF